MSDPHPWLCAFLCVLCSWDNLTLIFLPAVFHCCLYCTLVSFGVKSGKGGCSLMCWLSLNLRKTLCSRTQDDIPTSFPVDPHPYGARPICIPMCPPGKISPVLLQLLWVSTSALRFLSCRRDRNDGTCSFSLVDVVPSVFPNQPQVPRGKLSQYSSQFSL